MRGLRMARWGRPEVPEDRPVVIFANHPSWWDGVMFVLLARALFPGRPMFVPMEAGAFARYGFMKRIGAWGVEQDSPRAALGFLRTARTILQTTAHTLWINAPGRFVDARTRPQPMVAGLVRLPELAPEAIFLPLALEYPFWAEPRAEMLFAFGPGLAGHELAALDRPARAAAMAAALHATMDRLAEDALSRDPARFMLLARGQEGLGGAYDVWRRLKARLRGAEFDARHDPEAG